MNKMDYIYGDKGEKIVIETLQKSTKDEVIAAYAQCRKDAGMTQQMLSNRTGIDRPNITRFEGGKYNPSLEMLVRIAAAMGMRVKLTLEKDETIGRA